MVTIFTDTSAMFALVNSADENNLAAWDVWKMSIGRGDEFLMNNYTLVESVSLIQNRLGIPVVRKLLDNIVPLLHMVWIDEEQHETAINHVISANHRSLSLVDCASFETMRQLGIKTVFTFDKHFHEQGFNIIP